MNPICPLKIGDGMKDVDLIEVAGESSLWITIGARIGIGLAVVVSQRATVSGSANATLPWKPL